MKKSLFNASGLLLTMLFVACAEFSTDDLNPEQGNTTRTAENPEGNNYYWSGGRKIYIDTDRTKIIVDFDSEEMLRTFAANVSKENPFVGEAVALVDVLDAGVEQKISATKAVRNKIFASTYSGYNDAPFYMTGDILMQPKDGVSVKDILAKHEVDAETVTKTDVAVVVRLKDWGKLLSTANAIYESGMVDWCHPDFISQHKRMTNDQYFSQQYYLKNTGQTGGTAGVDINVEPAWVISKGNGIRVAVIDDGVEPHDDLAGRVLNGYTPKNPTGNNYNGGNGRPTSSGVHGQACAGILAASHNSGNNSYIAGVAPEAVIIPINIFYGGETVYDNAAAIEYAWNPNKGNADVISNSWGYRNGPPANADVLTRQIYNAIDLGRLRNGVRKGCVVVFSSGNSIPYKNVAYPADLTNVIAVGAVNKYGTVWNYSCRGSALDVVAPSGYTDWMGDVYTLDRMGAYGKNQENYMTYFGGTSAACPQVAGIAALMLSVNPNLTQHQVADAIIKSGSSYPSWNSQTGYGVVDATDAVLGAISGPDNPLYNTDTVYETFSSDITSGVSVDWSVLPSGSATIVENGHRATFKFSASGGNCTVQAQITVPGMATRTVSKTVSLKPHVPILHYTGMPYGITTPTTIRFTVTNAHPNAAYEWDPTQGVIMYATDDHMYVETPSVPFHNNSMYGTYVIVRCRALIAGAYSDWSPDYYMRIKYLE